MDRSVVHTDAIRSRVRFGFDDYHAHETADLGAVRTVVLEIRKPDPALMQGCRQGIGGAELGFCSIVGINDMQGSMTPFGTVISITEPSGTAFPPRWA